MENPNESENFLTETHKHRLLDIEMDGKMNLLTHIPKHKSIQQLMTFPYSRTVNVKW